MRGGITNVSLGSDVKFDGRADYFPVHAEPGEDKIMFANDVADWILARARPEVVDGPEAKSKL